MPFIMSSQFLEKVIGLQEAYERRTGVNLSNAYAPYSVACFFGAHNTLTRKKQCQFLSALYKEFQPFLDVGSQDNAQKWQASLISHRILLAGCVYVKSQIINSYAIKSPNSVMLTLLDEALGVTPQNQIDEGIKKQCLVAAEKWLTTGQQLEKESSASHSFKYLSKKDQADFACFLREELLVLKDLEQQSMFPIAKTMQPLLGASCALAGSQLGYTLAGFLVEKNSSATSFMLSALLKYSTSMHPATFIGIAVITPAITRRVLSSAYGFPLSWALGKGFELIGESVGFSIGMSLDLSLIVLKGTSNTLQAIIYHEEKNTHLSGLRLSDGCLIEDGVEKNTLDSMLVPVTRTAPRSQCHFNKEQYDIDLIEEVLGSSSVEGLSKLS